MDQASLRSPIAYPFIGGCSPSDMPSIRVKTHRYNTDGSVRVHLAPCQCTFHHHKVQNMIKKISLRTSNSMSRDAIPICSRGKFESLRAFFVGAGCNGPIAHLGRHDACTSPYRYQCLHLRVTCPKDQSRFIPSHKLIRAIHSADIQ